MAGHPGQKRSAVDHDPLHRAGAHHQVLAIAGPAPPAPAPAPPGWRALSRAMKLNISLRPSTSVSSASTMTSAPTGLARRCSSDADVPTEVMPEGRCGAIAATAAASARASSRGVASTGTSPLPAEIAVSASATTALTDARCPAATPIPTTLDLAIRPAGPSSSTADASHGSWP